MKEVENMNLDELVQYYIENSPEEREKAAQFFLDGSYEKATDAERRAHIFDYQKLL